MKEKLECRKNILRVVLGEIQTKEVQQGKQLKDDQVLSVIRKVIEGNEKLLTFKENSTLVEENSILKEYLPQAISSEEIRALLVEVKEEIMLSKSVGQATGVAIKHLKTKDCVFQGSDVSQVVSEIYEG